jgi:hypothetical protein
MHRKMVAKYEMRESINNTDGMEARVVAIRKFTVSVFNLTLHPSSRML